VGIASAGTDTLSPDATLAKVARDASPREAAPNTPRRTYKQPSAISKYLPSSPIQGAPLTAKTLTWARARRAAWEQCMLPIKPSRCCPTRLEFAMKVNRAGPVSVGMGSKLANLSTTCMRAVTCTPLASYLLDAPANATDVTMRVVPVSGRSIGLAAFDSQQ